MTFAMYLILRNPLSAKNAKKKILDKCNTFTAIMVIKDAFDTDLQRVLINACMSLQMKYRHSTKA